MRFGDLIASRASCLCDKTAVIYNDKEYSYAEIDANANSVAAFLRANGIGVGNHVVYIAYNSEMYFEILTGLLSHRRCLHADKLENVRREHNRTCRCYRCKSLVCIQKLS